MTKVFFWSSFLLSFFLHLSVTAAFTVVLKNGKRIDGTFISDTTDTIQIRDSQGVILSLKKKAVDLQQTIIPNISNQSLSSTPNSEQVGTEAKYLNKQMRNPLGDSTQRNQSTPQSRKYTNADLEKMYGPLTKSQSTNDYSGIEYEATAGVQQKETSSDSAGMIKLSTTTLYGGRTETEWWTEGITLRDAWKTAASEYIRLSEKCVPPPSDVPDDLSGLEIQMMIEAAIACRELEKAKVSLSDAESKIMAFESRARGAGVPPGVYEFERLSDTGLGMGKIER